MTTRILNVLRKLIEQHEFLWIIDECSNNDGLAVHDRRPDIGDNLGTWIASEDSLAYLIRYGAEAWCYSRFNGDTRNLDR